MFTSALSQRGWVVLWALLALCYSRPTLGQDDPFAPAKSQKAETCESCSKAVQSLAVESPRASAARNALRAALDSTTTLEFIDSPMHDIFAYLGEVKGIQIVIDKRALDDLGLATDTPMTIELREISLRAVLDHLLREFDLTYVVWNETLLITSVDESLEGNFQTVKVYPVSDLLRKADDGSLEYDVLINAITTVLDPDSWIVAGGTGTIEPIAGTLVVGQTDQVHEQIEQLFEILRDVGKPER